MSTANKVPAATAAVSNLFRAVEVHAGATVVVVDPAVLVAELTHRCAEVGIRLSNRGDGTLFLTVGARPRSNVVELEPIDSPRNRAILDSLESGREP